MFQSNHRGLGIFFYFLQPCARGSDSKIPYPAAQFKLVLMYMRGLGVEQNHEAAFYWAKSAATSSNATAKYLLGYMYYKGMGTVQNNEMAVIWLEDALVSGQEKAKDLLVIVEKEQQQELSSL